MNDYPTSTTPIEVRGLRQLCEVNGQHFSCRRGTQQWIEYKPDNAAAPPTDPSPLYLSLIHQNKGPGEPCHWSLFVALGNEPGVVYQVKGDSERIRYVPSARPVNVVNSASFLNLYQLAIITEQQSTVVRQIAESDSPPKAENHASVKENCQGWVVRVIAKLVDKNLVPDTKLQMAKSMMEPV